MVALNKMDLQDALELEEELTSDVKAMAEQLKVCLRSRRETNHLAE